MDANHPPHPVKAITSGPSKETTPRFLWLNGPPGSGKSVASGHVIRYLESVNLDCAHFFFKSNEKPSLTQFLLSMALQMAESNFQIRHTFLAMMEEGETIDSHSDHVMVWNNIFLGRIFKMTQSQPQYWVIDALDECPSRLLATLMSMFSRIEPTVPLRIFITSRPSGHVERLLNQERIMRAELHTGQAESLKDIDAFVRSRLSPNIIQDFKEEEGDLVAEIIEKSNGIFLWASLIMTRLDEAHSIEAMRKTLDQVPSEMSGMYSGILESIMDSPNAELAHCVLKWVVCARQPLTTDELREVVRLDINQTLRTSDRFAQICGNLITVDNDLVQVMHQTVKEFLTGEQSDYYIPRSWSHARIAELCLQHLNGRNFSPPRTRRAPAVPSKTDNNAVFDDYASTNFSYHLAHCSPSESTLELLPLLGTFFSSNVLTWIERVAKTGRLSPLTRTIQNLKVYLDRQVATSSPLDSDYQLASRFVDDLVRLSAIHGPNLVNTPSSIYSLVPLLCPKSSIIHWKFAREQFRQKVLCTFNNDWDERLSSFSFPSRALSIACADQFFAVGLGDGSIRVYRQSTFELVNSLQHGEPVRRLASGNITGVLVSAGLRTVRVWGGGGAKHALLWSATVPEQPLSLLFSLDDSKVYVPLRNGEVYAYRVKNGVRLDELAILGEDLSSSSDSDSDGGGHMQKRTMPMLIRISPMLGIAAIAHRSSHLQLSYYESGERVEAFEKEGYEDGWIPPQVLDVAFNENPEQNLMAVAYQDGDLVTLDPWTLQQKQTYHLNAHTLAASPDGHTLAAGDSECVISLFAFDGLRLLCRIESLEERIMGIVFAGNSRRLFDLRGNTCNVWEPAVLIKKNLTDDSSSEEADDYLMPASSLVCTRTFEGSKAITAMTRAGESNYVFCGREEGSITVHDVSSGRMCAEFQYHARMVDIRHLEWNAQGKVLFSVDASRRCIATRLTLPTSTAATTAVQKQQQQLQLQQFEPILDFRATDTVLQALISPDASTFLVSTQSGEELHSPSSGCIAQSTHSQNKARWLSHPTDPTRLLLFDNESEVLHVFNWKDLSRETPARGITIDLPPELASTPVTLSDEWHSRPGLGTLLQTIAMPHSSRTGFLTLDLSAIDDPATATSVQVACTARQLVSHVKSVLGIHRSSLFFLSGRGWVCSISLKSLNPNSAGSSSKAGYYIRHFFIPSVWQTGGEPIARVVCKTSVAMVYRDEVVVLQGFLEFEHKAVFEEEESKMRALVPVIKTS
ncbi:WD40 repeat-like protein [Parathielavia hyrcaniae]|uniref:WD40 repeat-like protein n=1 Tax=Parathielavia hyrcaniae TaxID=113614 RepID=A0AAN6Q2X9_9PEZI|nr:WD40 repeat-like protein [Parathielavia hyrcaniae]